MLKTVLALVLTLFLLSCGSESGGTGPDPDPSVATTVTVSPPTASLTSLGATTQFSAVVKDQNGGTMSGAPVSWASSNTSVLTVSSSGLGTAVGNGTATVSATSGSANGSGNATVQQVPTQVQITLASDQVTPGSTTQASVAVSDAGGSQIPSPSITWASADPSVATVDNGGLVTGLGAGLVFIKATHETLSDSVRVSVAEVLELEELNVLTDGTGGAAVFSLLGGGTHFQLEVKDEQGLPLQGALVEYGEVEQKAVFAIRKNGHAPAFLIGTVEELKGFGESYSPSVSAIRNAASFVGTEPQRDIGEAILLRVSLPGLTEAALSVLQDALQMHTFFHDLGFVEFGTDGLLRGRKCMTWAAFAQHQIDQLASIPGWKDVVTTLVRGAEESPIDPDPDPGKADIYFSAQDVVNLLTGEDFLQEKINLLGSLLDDSPTGRMVEVEWDFGDSGPPFLQELGSYRVNTNDPYCGGAIPASIHGHPETINGAPGGTVEASVLVMSEFGNPAPFAEVTFVLDTGHGSLNSGDLQRIVTADGDGLATVSWTFPGTEGLYTLTASTTGADGVVPTTTLNGYAQVFPLVPTPTSLVTGIEHTCGITPFDEVYCWGKNVHGELGINRRYSHTDDTAWQSSPVAVLIPTGVTFDALVAGGHHTCALSEVGYAYCWGRNEYLQIGAEDPWTPVLTPFPVPGAHVFTSLTAGSHHNCGLTETGVAYCWGRNNKGQLGDGTQTDRWVPAIAAEGKIFSSLFAGGVHTCGIDKQTGAGYCWGANDQGQLGNGSFNDDANPTPSPVTAISSFQTMAAGWYHTCGVGGDGKVYCWGKNRNGQLGTGSYNAIPNPIPAITNPEVELTSLTAGGQHTCGVTSGGTAYCWGRADKGQIGFDAASNLDRHSPTLVAGGRTFPVLSAGSLHTCGLESDGTPWCWGSNAGWQLGQGEAGTPTPVTQRTPIEVITGYKFGRKN